MKPSKHFCCTICQRGFTRIDHLKRHHLRRTLLPQFPPLGFALIQQNPPLRLRCEALFVHFLQRSFCSLGVRLAPSEHDADAWIPVIICVIITQIAPNVGTVKFPKLDREVDDDMHANHSCVKRNLECSKDWTSPAASNDLNFNSNSPVVPGSPSVKNEGYDRPSDRGSIKFLLNRGTESFTEDFLLPPRSDRTRGLDYHHQKEEAESSMLPYHLKDDPTSWNPAFLESEPTALSFFQDTFLDFFNGPFGDLHKSVGDPYAGGMAGYQATLLPEQNHSLGYPGQQPYEPEKPFATAMIQAIISRAWLVPLDAKLHEEISTSLTFLLRTWRIRKFISLYFKYWQPSCTMIHCPSFDPETVSLPLLASVIFMGAMYSKDERELYIAKRVLDFVELFVFSSELFSCESEIARTICGDRNPDHGALDWPQFQNFQAGFLMVVVQYWAGGRVSRNRAMENRFSEIIKVARRIGLIRYHHNPEDSMDETIWIQRQCRIRTMNMVSLLDCAFSFYQNYPCHLTHTESHWEFPCLESTFALEHPFTDPDFQVSRGITIADAFDSLFEDYNAQETSQTASGIPASEIIATLTVLDMFILIHVLYAFINTHMTVLAPLLRFPQRSSTKSEAGSARSSKRRPSLIQEDSTLTAIRTALSRWRDHWLALRSTVSSHEWASMGFFKNGYNFWLVSQLLITKKESVDVVMKMEVRCEDKLEKLKVLLKDEND
ncbi:hypothetical protein ARAM_003613 [Aspergillus rambellii]|uniref:Xylanolytic transcriptional activator regulatory domain-containing protein n=1 Tax=Aspergillus rambellii TaxID=308745 RepID=A0A0F8V5Z2_9EURO|nr:hypothetical protein ARAM_003613 [Aspergillus rambellii]